MIANLFICLTPLQALIAQQLIRQFAPAPADLLMVCYAEADNEKFRHYFAQTAAMCRQANYVVVPNGRWARAWHLSHLLDNLAPCYHIIFAASIDNPNVQYPLSHLSFDELHTFDDGTGNLYPSSILYHNPQHSLKRQIINRLQGIRYQTEDLRQLSCVHYTLYPNQPNIIEHTVPICLWQPENHHGSEVSGCLKSVRETLLLGQPLLNGVQNQALAEQLLKHLSIAHYFPHPRETFMPRHSNIITTPLIFEDWLVQQLKQQPEKQFVVYHLASTAALNVATMPHVQVRAIRPKHSRFRQPEFIYLYDLMEKMSIPIHDIP